MHIVIECQTMAIARELYNDICEELKDKVIYKQLYGKTIRFNNGITLDVISKNCRTDGMYADIAYGPNAQYITYSSQIDKPVKTLEEIIEYIKEHGNPSLRNRLIRSIRKFFLS